MSCNLCFSGNCWVLNSGWWHDFPSLDVIPDQCLNLHLLERFCDLLEPLLVGKFWAGKLLHSRAPLQSTYWGLVWSSRQNPGQVCGEDKKVDASYSCPHFTLIISTGRRDSVFNSRCAKGLYLDAQYNIRSSFANICRHISSSIRSPIIPSYFMIWADLTMLDIPRYSLKISQQHFCVGNLHYSNLNQTCVWSDVPAEIHACMAIHVGTEPYCQFLSFPQNYTLSLDLWSRADSKDEVHLGFCFSFPVEQTAIDEGKILYMTKKFANKGANGADPVGLLQDACKRHGGNVSFDFTYSLKNLLFWSALI